MKSQHNLISIFFNSKDYNLNIIKINSFFIGFTIEYAIISLFYIDNTKNKFFKWGKGDFKNL